MDHFSRYEGTFFLDPRVKVDSRAPSFEMFATARGAACGLWSNTAAEFGDLLAGAGLTWTAERRPVFATGVPNHGEMLSAPHHRAIVRSDTQQVLAVVSSAYAVAQHAMVAQTAFALARQYNPAARLIGAAPLGRDDADALMVVLVERSKAGALCILGYNTHGGEGAVHFRLVKVDRESGAVLVPDTQYVSVKEPHQGNIERRLRELQDTSRGHDWIVGYLADVEPAEAELMDRECTPTQSRQLIQHLWPQTYKVLMAEAGELHHPEDYLINGPLADAENAWTVFLRLCEYLDHRSEARERGDATKDRAERLARGAGDRLKRKAWSWLLENTYHRDEDPWRRPAE
jgi:hypothetical protein